MTIILRARKVYAIIKNILGLLNFQKTGDQDGFVADLSAKTKLTSEIYQIKIKTEPGGGLFEASITYNVNKNLFNTKVS